MAGGGMQKQRLVFMKTRYGVKRSVVPLLRMGSPFVLEPLILG